MIGFFLMADLLGFGRIITNLDGPNRDRRIDGWLELVGKGAEAHGIDNVQLISDTVFAAAPEGDVTSERLVRFAQHLLNEGIAQAVPIRGAITHGEFEWGRLTYGPAVVRAYQLESSQEWIGVTCDSGLPGTDDLWGFGSLIVYPTPLKSGPIQLMPVVDWDVPAPSELSAALGRDGLSRDGEILNWSYGDKLNNTLAFGNYRILIKKHRANPASFYGLSPQEIVYNVVRGLRIEGPDRGGENANVR